MRKSIEWDESARTILTLARQESFAIGDEYIGTQHLLLAAAAVAPSESRILRRDHVLAAIIECVGLRDPGTVLISPGGQTPRTKLAITRAVERAMKTQRPVSCRDVWFGLLQDEESECLKVIRHLGLDVRAMRRELT